MSAAPKPEAPIAAPPYRAVAEGLPALDESGRPGPLVAGRCRACGTLSPPASSICPGCWSAESCERVPLSTRGVLYAYTVVRNAPPGFAAPYVIGYVDLPEGVRVMARLDGEPPPGLTVGASVRVAVTVIAQEEDGTRIVGPGFIVAAEEEGSR